MLPLCASIRARESSRWPRIFPHPWPRFKSHPPQNGRLIERLAASYRTAVGGMRVAKALFMHTPSAAALRIQPPQSADLVSLIRAHTSRCRVSRSLSPRRLASGMSIVVGASMYPEALTKRDSSTGRRVVRANELRPTAHVKEMCGVAHL